MTDIVIIDHHVIIREGIKGVLESQRGMKVVGTGDIYQAVSLVKTYSPDIVLMDFDVSLSETIGTIHKLFIKFPNIKLLLITDELTTSMVKESIAAGVIGFMAKSANRDEIVKAVGLVHRGKPYISPFVASSILIEFRKLLLAKGVGPYLQLDVRKPFHLLTKKECDVLQLLAEGKNNRELAEALFISEKTVKNHVSNVLLKMEVKDRTNAVIKAIKNGWVELN